VNGDARMRNRRSFLREAMLAAAGLAVLPRISLRAADKTGARPPITGSGEHTYECLHDWLQPPEGLLWGETHALCEDEEGNLYVGHTVHKDSRRGEAIVAYDAQGRFIRAFGSEFRGGAHGLALHREPEGVFLYHSDILHCTTAKLTLGGELVWKRGYPREDREYGARPIAYRPTNIAFSPGGDYFVADGYGSSHVLRYAADGRFLGEVGRRLEGKSGRDAPDGALSTPHSLWVDLRGAAPVLAVADRSNHRIQAFGMDGAHRLTVKDRRLRLPCHCHTRGDWMVCPDLDSQVCILDRDYRIVAQLGDGKPHNGAFGSRRTQSRAQFTPGEFIHPHDAIFLGNGDILVSEWLPIGRITRLRRVSG